MRNNRLFGKLVITALVILTTVGCKKFLDAPSVNQVKQDELFSSETGFQTALDGVYMQMGANCLFGKELNYGFMSILSRSYDANINSGIGNLYYKGYQYDFQNPDIKKLMKNIWDSTYSCILILNNLINQMPEKKTVFTGSNYNKIMGEAVALRAFLHFELLRIFGPANPAQNLSTVVLPYMKTVTPLAQTFNDVNSVITLCITDLKEARSLFSDKAFLAGHLNYWGSTGLLARIYLYKGDYANARLFADEVINSNKFLLAKLAADYPFANENLFGIFVNTVSLNSLFKSVFKSSTPIGFSNTNQTELFVKFTGATVFTTRHDWRVNFTFLDPATNGASNTSATAIFPKKLNYENLPANASNTVSLIRLPEMYYIAAECANNDLDTIKATALLDTVRFYRGLQSQLIAPLTYRFPALGLKRDSVTSEIRKEYMKEFLGEAQAFYYFKRKNLNIPTLPFTVPTVPLITNPTYVLPKPE
jgi:hypothetical protein